jgi:ligand-binding sensor protein
MELSDIMPIEKWKQLAEDIYTRFGFNGAVYDQNNNVLAKSEEWANKICPAIKAGEARIICASAQQRLSKVAQEKREPATEECEIGLVKFVVPIFLNEEFVGTVGGCGCVLENSEADEFYVGKLLKKEEGEIKDLLTTVRRISQDKAAEALRYVQEKVKEILSNKSF